jgi:hypothetical protein
VAQKLKIENVTEGSMQAYENGFILTQVELCKKLPPLKKEFALLRTYRQQESLRIYAQFKL